MAAKNLRIRVWGQKNKNKDKIKNKFKTKGSASSASGGKKSVLVSKSTRAVHPFKTVVKPKPKQGKSKEAKEQKAKEAKEAKEAAKLTKKSQTATQKDYSRPNYAKRLVWEGKKEITRGGLRKRNLMCNRHGKIVSKKVSQQARKSFFDNHLDLWNKAMCQQRDQAGLTGFVKAKKNGSEFERLLFRETRKVWEDAVASRVVHMMQKQPQLVGKISRRLHVDGLESPFLPSDIAMAAALSIKQEVKTEPVL